MRTAQQRHEAERAHGKWLMAHDPVRQWGHQSPAGAMRAERRARLIADGARLAPGVNALEIGCGTGMFSEMFARSGASLLCVDISPDLVAAARERFAMFEREREREREDERKNVEFMVAPFEECDARGPFDAIIGSSVLHHLDTDAAFPRIYSLLKPGGFMSFCEPNFLNPQIWLERTFRRWFPQVSPDETAFVAASLRRDLARHGFADIEITPFDWLHPATPAPLIPLVKRLGAWCEACPGVRAFAGSLRIVARRPPGSLQE